MYITQKQEIEKKTTWVFYYRPR